MAGWGDLAGKIAQQFQGRIERIKNEKEGLLNERNKLLNDKITARSSDRIIAIDTRVCEINRILANKSSD